MLQRHHKARALRISNTHVGKQQETDKINQSMAIKKEKSNFQGLREEAEG